VGPQGRALGFSRQQNTIHAEQGIGGLFMLVACGLHGPINPTIAMIDLPRQFFELDDWALWFWWDEIPFIWEVT
jgi:hypothetical protein